MFVDGRCLLLMKDNFAAGDSPVPNEGLVIVKTGQWSAYLLSAYLIVWSERVVRSYVG